MAGRNRTAVKQIHSLAPETNTGSGHSGRHGIRTHTSFRAHALAVRSGKPYPATFRFKWTAGESNPDFLVANQASSHWTSSPYFRIQEVRPGIEPGLPPYHGSVQPKHLQTLPLSVIPDGVEPSSPACHAGVVAVGPRDQIE